MKLKRPSIDPTFNPPGPGVFLRIRTTTMGNGSRRHWTVTKRERACADMAVFIGRRRGDLPAEFGNGLTVKFTRYAPGTLDTFGNIQSSFKAIVDGMADCYGVDDRDPRWTFETPVQVKTKARQYGVRIEIEGKP